MNGNHFCAKGDPLTFEEIERQKARDNLTKPPGDDISTELAIQVDDLTRQLSEAREAIWLNHGCQGLYGDDGEMQCSNCMIDFKRDHIGKIVSVLSKMRVKLSEAREEIARLRKALEVISCADKYGKPGHCPMGCNSPEIAQAALEDNDG